jgi:hypothetical protein
MKAEVKIWRKIVNFLKMKKNNFLTKNSKMNSKKKLLNNILFLIKIFKKKPAPK